MNKLVLSIFVVLFVMCTVMAVLSANWERKQGMVCGDGKRSLNPVLLIKPSNLHPAAV